MKTMLFFLKSFYYHVFKLRGEATYIYAFCHILDMFLIVGLYMFGGIFIMASIFGMDLNPELGMMIYSIIAFFVSLIVGIFFEKKGIGAKIEKEMEEYYDEHYNTYMELFVYGSFVFLFFAAFCLVICATS